MQVLTKQSVIPLPRPNTFAGLMELYESNYIKIKKLCGNFNNLDEYAISNIDKGLDLHIRIVERNKYTITLNLTYQFSHLSEKPRNFPNLLVRVYFDAMQAEVLQRETRSTALKTFPAGHLRNKWRDNRFLFKWLTFCLHQGHSFDVKNSRPTCTNIVQ